MPWYAGEPLLAHLEGAPEAVGAADGPARLPVQYVIRHDERAPLRRPARLRHAARRRRGRRPALRRPQPRGARGRPARRRSATPPRPPPSSVVLEDDLDVGRGDLIARASEAPEATRELSATVCWLGDAPARAGATYLLKHTTRTVRAKLDAIEDRLDVTTLEREPADGARAQRHRPRPPAHGRRGDRRPVRGQPRDRRVHPHRRGDKRHGRRWDGRLRQPTTCPRTQSADPPYPYGRDDGKPAGAAAPYKPADRLPLGLSVSAQTFGPATPVRGT